MYPSDFLIFFSSFWLHTVERYRLDNLPTKPHDSRNDVVLPDALDPLPMFSAEWETPLTKNYESSDNTKILNSVPDLSKIFELNKFEFNHIN